MTTDKDMAQRMALLEERMAQLDVRLSQSFERLEAILQGKAPPPLPGNGGGGDQPTDPTIPDLPEITDEQLEQGYREIALQNQLLYDRFISENQLRDYQYWLDRRRGDGGSNTQRSGQSDQADSKPAAGG